MFFKDILVNQSLMEIILFILPDVSIQEIFHYVFQFIFLKKLRCSLKNYSLFRSFSPWRIKVCMDFSKTWDSEINEVFKC